MSEPTSPGPVLLYAVYTRALMCGPAADPANPQYAAMYRWYSADKKADAERDVAEGLANGVEKELTPLTEAHIRSLQSVKLRLAASAAAGLTIE